MIGGRLLYFLEKGLFLGGEIAVDFDLLAFEEEVLVEVDNGLCDFVDYLIGGGDFIGESWVHEEGVGGLVFSFGVVESVFSEAHFSFWFI